MLRKHWLYPTLFAIMMTVAVGKDSSNFPQLNITRNADDELTGRFDYSFIIGTFYEWNTDPTAIPGLFDEYARRTGIQADIDFIPLSLADPGLNRNPLLIMTGNRHFRLTDEEQNNLSRYLRNGGMLYADDCGGADQSFRRMISKLLDGLELQQLPADHPLFSSFYQLEKVPKIVDLYQGPAQAFGGFLDGRLAIVYTYDTDIPCGWEKNPDGSFLHILAPGKHEQSIRFGVNVLHYALGQLADQKAAVTD